MVRCHGLPEGVLFDILLYLPVMSLPRFKYVCKFWCSIIENPTFITQQLSHNNDEGTLIIQLPPSSESRQFYLLFGNQYEKSVYIDFDQLHWHPVTELSLVGSCNGIVCLDLMESLDIALWNPALKQLRPLPLPLFCGRYDEARLLGNVPSHFTMLGIDIRTGDYKVVSIFLFPYKRPENYTELGILRNQVEVYNVREKSWRIIYEDDALPFMYINSKAVFSRKSGKCFWRAWDAEGSPKLLSFDFNDEVFGTMSYPDYHEGTLFSHAFSGLDIHNETLVFIRQAVAYSGSSFEIWMLHEFGVEESWTKMYKFVLPYQHAIIPGGISRNGEFLVSSSLNSDAGDDLLHLHNLRTQQGFFLPFSPYDSLMHYNASLISIQSANGEV